MPKARIEKTVSDDGVTKTIEREVGQRGETKVATYTIASNAGMFRKLVEQASILPNKNDKGKETESDLNYLYRMYATSVEREACANVYESLVEQSTFITLPDKTRKDVMTYPLLKLVKAINGYRANVELRMGDDDSDESRLVAERAVRFGPWKKATSLLLEKELVRENEASGTLEVVA